MGSNGWFNLFLINKGILKVNNWVIWLIILLFLLLLANSYLIVYYRRYYVNELQGLFQENNRLKKDIKAVCRGAIGVGSRLSNLEAHIDMLAVRQDQAELRQPALSSYSHATKMVAMGAKEEDIMANCGLTRAEAQLVVMLYSKSSGSVLST